MIEKIKLKNGKWENYPLQYWKNLSDYTGSASAWVVSNRHTASWNVRKPKEENLEAFTSTAIKKRGNSSWHQTFLEFTLQEILKWLYVNIINL